MKETNEIERIDIETMFQDSGHVNSKIPIFQSAQASNILGEHSDLPESFLDSSVFGNADFCMRYVGDAMWPDLHSGDYLLCIELRTLVYGEIYLIITTDGKEFIRKLEMDKDDKKINLVASNKRYPTITIDESSMKKAIRIKGIMRSFDIKFK